jgi:hypothetical protein
MKIDQLDKADKTINNILEKCFFAFFSFSSNIPSKTMFLIKTTVSIISLGLKCETR